jgi:hypothetical protein
MRLGRKIPTVVMRMGVNAIGCLVVNLERRMPVNIGGLPYMALDIATYMNYIYHIMNLYHVQDADRSMWVAAHDWQEAVSRWKLQIAKENNYALLAEVGEPQGVQLVCENDNPDFPEYLP